MLRKGLYEQVINRELDALLSAQADLRSQTAPIDDAEAAKVLSAYAAGVLEQGLEALKEGGGDMNSRVRLVNRIVEVIKSDTGDAEFDAKAVAARAEQLLALYDSKDAPLAEEKQLLVRPESSLSRSSLFTGSRLEPQLYSELCREIASCDSIDMLVSFIKWSGLRLLYEPLKAFTRKGGTLRIITTSYMGATDMKAVMELNKLPNTQIKITYNTADTRLHAKAYIFRRETGFTTAYVGSSNLSRAAQTGGTEWNMKLTGADQGETIAKINATFENYWNSSDYETYEDSQRERLARALKAEHFKDHNDANLYTLDIRPYAFQQEILDRLEAERCLRGHFKNLIVAATGTGKTVVSALDYRRFRRENPGKPCRLLFVAHRVEILQQSLSVYRAVLKDENFGAILAGTQVPQEADYLFMSVQSFNAKEFESKTRRDTYDYIVVDEFHHACAPSYQKLLAYYTPKVLLGLTATPERMDGKNVLEYFDDRIAAEIRLPEAIERGLLCPFQYFGISDCVNLDDVKWTAGGYDKSVLTERYKAQKRADLIVRQLLHYVTDIDGVKGLGFCVSVEHAEFMNGYFNACGIPSLCLTGETEREIREQAKKKLTGGEIRFIFTVDLYNEGVDIPEINTVLFLRPTESLTVFLQQLGRGLRLCEGKDCLTVLDFVGQANKHYSFESKFNALLTNTSRGLEHEIRHSFLSLPKGCYIQLEKKAMQYILENIRSSYSSKAGLVGKIADFSADTGKKLSYAAFLDHYGMEPKALYKCGSFSRLCVSAGVKENFDEPAEKIMEGAFERLATLDSQRLLQFLLSLLPRLKELHPETLSPLEKRMFNMFWVTVFLKPVTDFAGSAVAEKLKLLADSPVLMGELHDLLAYRLDKIDVLPEAVHLGFDCPLDVHCTYTRDQLFVALDFLKPDTVREGVKWLPDIRADVLLVTLNKSEKDYSPTTMYNDYSVNETLFHWQSQSVTGANSPTGQRYIHHAQMGSRVLLFVREYKKDPASGATMAYTFLGTASYVRHEGSRPMNILWRLDAPIPSKFYKKTNKLMIG